MLWSAFYPELLIFTGSAPIPLLEMKARQAAIEFFQRSRTWVEWLDPALSLEGSVEYDFDIPSQSDVARVERATVDGKPIEILSYRDIPHDWASVDVDRQGLVSRDLKIFRLGQVVAAGLEIRVQVALTPSRASTGLPDDLFDKYRDDIVHGALSKLLALPSLESYNPEMAKIGRAHV